MLSAGGRRILIRALPTCLATALLAVGLASSAGADDVDSSERYEISLPPAIDLVDVTRVPFTVSAPSAVCAVGVEGGGSVTGSGPYLLTIDPAAFNADALVQMLSVVVTTCDGLGFYQQVEVRTPYVVASSALVAPWGERKAERNLAVSILATEVVPVNVSVLRNGAVYRELGTFTGPKDLSIAIPKSQASGSWAVQVRSPAGDRRQPFTVARQWSPLLSGDTPLARFPACSTVTWTYDATGQPKAVADPERDIAEALRRMATLTALRFKRVDADADLKFSWADLGGGQVDAVGGGQFGERGYQGQVTLNVRSDWVKHPGFGRVRSRGGLPARGYLLLHEIGHVLGLGHVDDRTQVMFREASPRSPISLAQGDRRGLDYLYRPEACS
jgi:hypothetical protein